MVFELRFEAPMVPFPHFKSLFMEKTILRTKGSVILLVCHSYYDYELLIWDFRNSTVSGGSKNV